MPSGANPAKSVDDGEIARFAALADEWWCGDGELRMLHQLNPVRSAYIRDHASAHFGLDASGAQPLKGLRIIDIGCGGGILAEPLARMGAGLVGLDADENAIEAAKLLITAAVRESVHVGEGEQPVHALAMLYGKARLKINTVSVEDDLREQGPAQ